MESEEVIEGCYGRFVFYKFYLFVLGFLLWYEWFLEELLYRSVVCSGGFVKWVKVRIFEIF